MFHVIGLQFSFAAGHVGNRVKRHFVVEAESAGQAWEVVRNGEPRVEDVHSVHHADECEARGCT